SPRLDKVLGLEEIISPRGFLDGTLLASGAAAITAMCPAEAIAQSAGRTGYTGEGDYRDSAGNSETVVHSAHNAHAVRDGAYDRISSGVTDTGEVYDCLVLGFDKPDPHALYNLCDDPDPAKRHCCDCWRVSNVPTASKSGWMGSEQAQCQYRVPALCALSTRFRFRERGLWIARAQGTERGSWAARRESAGAGEHEYIRRAPSRTVERRPAAARGTGA